MAVTSAQLAVALRISTTGTDLPSAITSQLDRILGAAGEWITSYINNEDVALDEDLENEATIRLSAYLYDMSGSDRGARNPMVASGCAALLDRFRTSRTTLVEEVE